MIIFRQRDQIFVAMLSAEQTPFSLAVRLLLQELKLGVQVT